MKINEADYVVAVDAANNKQMLTIHQAVLQERDELKAQVEQLQHRVNDLKAANKLSGKCLVEVKVREFRKGYISALITYTDEPVAWCEKQADEHTDQLRQAAKGCE
ncbi:hypothetical protein [Alishewanella phage vB_AspM_Slicko01]|nr:hypothetical protein [Alishewanella phage vB_AspM_Slicko01]